MVIQHNLTTMNINRQMGIINKGRAKSSERLASGYRINRAADDAAGLSISEKMRAQIRGLERGSANVMDGVSWIQTGEGALGETTALLQRMRELTIYSLNDTLVEEDRAALQAEFDQLQSEIDKIALETEFNTQNVFEEHEPTYYSVKGNRVWDQAQMHTVEEPHNTLTLELLKKEGEPTVTVTITVPPGRYTTQELIDEFDDAMIASGVADMGVNIEYTKDGTCNINYEGGEDVVGIKGGMSYLLYNVYDKGSAGSLLGTTLFYDGFPLQVTNQNNHLEFTLVDYFGNETPISLDLDPGWYDKQEMIDILNQEFAARGLSTVEALPHGDYSIKIYSEDYFITGLKGNMFKIDDPSIEDVYSSVFYDNIKYGTVTETYGYFKGGAVLTTNVNDTDHNRFVITDANNTLKIRVNGEPSNSYVTVTLANGSYTATQMAAALNSLFAAESLQLTASAFTEGSFQGIRMDSAVNGVDSKIEFNVNESSAYNTLFRECTYATLLSRNPISGVYSYGAPSSTGGKTISFPLTLEDGGNRFNLKVNGTDYGITLTPGTYANMDELIDEIDEQINGSGAPAGLKGKITVSSEGGRIKFTANAGSEITSVYPSGIAGNTGYDDLFVGSRTVNYESEEWGAGVPQQIELEYPMGTVIDGSNDQFVIIVDGVARTVTMPHGTMDEEHLDDLVDIINAQVGREEIDVAQPYNVGPDYGENRNAAQSGRGGTSALATFNETVKGTGVPVQGSTQEVELTPAKYTIPVNLPASMTIDGSNNQFTCTVNGSPVVLYLDEGTYSQAELAAEIQRQFDAQLTGNNGVDVTLDGNRLCVATRAKGASSSLQFSSTVGTFLYDLCHEETAGTATLYAPLEAGITIGNGSNAFSFTLNDSARTVTLKNGTYDRAGFISMLNECFAEQGLGVQASLNGNYLRLTTTTTGTNASVAINTAGVGSSANAIFGDLLSPASITIPHAVQDSVAITNSTNTINLTINGQPVTVTIPNGNYTPDSLVTALNNQLSGRATVALDSSNRLVFTTTATGTSASIAASSNNGGSALMAIFGAGKQVTGGVTAEKSADGTKIIIKGSESYTQLRFTSASSAGNREFLPRTSATFDVFPTTITGSLDSRKANIQGAALTQPITITSKNQQLDFMYGPGGQPVSITLAEGDYTYDELKQALQDGIDDQIGAGRLVVEVDASGVRIEAIEAVYYTHNMSNFSGGFHRYVISGSPINTSYKDVLRSDGRQIINPAYAIGRQDVRNQEVQIIAGSNDELSLDVTIDGTVHHIEMVLDPGVYKGNGLAAHVQAKLNQALRDQGIQEGMVEVGIGGVNSGVAGSNDNNALVFRLSEDYVLDKEGEYIIDGVSGSAAFYIFYKTDGVPIPAYITGTNDISDGVVIKEGEETFSFVVDDEEYEYSFPPGQYTAQEIVDKLNDLIQNESVGEVPPVIAMLDGDNLKLSFTKFGSNSIHSVSGLAKGDVFYEEEGRIDGITSINIQLTGSARDLMNINKPRVSTTGLGINSIVITQRKYANKALLRLDKAIDGLLSHRSYYGASQNRLDHVKAVNDNTAENVQAGESRLRDVNMAKEMVVHSKNAILLEAAQAMMAQANSNNSGVLQLLR